MPYQWDEERLAYVYPSGRRVPNSVVDRALERVIRQGSDHMRDLTELLQEGRLSLSAWQTSMAIEMKNLHVGAAAFGRGGWQQMSYSDWGWTGQQLRQQYGFLRSFAQEIATGHAPMDGRMVNRATMYAEAARGTQRGMVGRVARAQGLSQERNILGAAEQHCAACVSCTLQDWVPVGTLPMIGMRTCLSRCHCYIEYRDVPMAEAA